MRDNSPKKANFELAKPEIRVNRLEKDERIALRVRANADKLTNKKIGEIFNTSVRQVQRIKASSSETKSFSLFL